MKITLKTLATVLLLFNSAGAVYGGIGLILTPDGTSIGLDIRLLENSPFNSYLIPGIVLLTVNGIGSLLVALSMIKPMRNYTLYIIAQGVMLCGWLGIQMLMIDLVYFLHYVMGVTGIALIILGAVLRKQESITSNQARAI